MSKMPAKKKSCFQITSVTQAQVAAIGAADDTESLEDPDESRAEDVSSEIYDMSRPEYDPTCDRSSSEEALNNVGEQEAISVLAPSHIPQPSQVSALTSSPVGEFRKVGAPGSAQGIGIPPGSSLLAQAGAAQQQQFPPAASAGTAGGSVNTIQPATVTSTAPAATTTASCTSRFRVIKLDHGIGEPFRRGRWTCTEFYEKDSEGSAVSRTADNTRHAGATVDPAADGGIGPPGGSVVTPSHHSGQGFGSGTDASLSSPRMHLIDTVHQPNSTRAQGVSGLPTPSAFSSSKPAAVSAQPAVGSAQASAPHGVLPAGQNDLSQSGVHIQKSPIMPPSVPSMTYPLQPQQQQLPVSHHLSSQSDYYQQQPGLAIGQVQPASGLSAGLQSVGQGHASGLSSASGGAPDVVGAGGAGSVMFGQPAPGLIQQQPGTVGGIGGSSLTGSSTVQQQSGGQYAATGQPQPHSLHSSSASGQNVPAIAVSASASTTVPTVVPSASSAVMPNVTASSLPPGHQPHSKPAPALGSQGLPAVGFGHVEGSDGAKSEGLVNAQSPVVSGKEALKPLMPESLQLTTPTVNSLFGIQIPVDGDVDRASGTNVAAIDNKIEQAMDLVKSHLMYAVREEVEVLKEQIKELFERNSVLERENAVLKSLANSEQLSQLPSQSASGPGCSPPQQGLSQPPQQPAPPQAQHHPKPPQAQTQPDPGQQPPSVTSA
ncbi:LOW QUALITY PROTEIN: TSC22 domain family protein 2-like [Takifugu flavidus]|nr:LOW QUALITY PROTEIN: TSC22 domain family protein 2-like [Takifugu flavidus]